MVDDYYFLSSLLFREKKTHFHLLKMFKTTKKKLLWRSEQQSYSYSRPVLTAKVASDAAYYQNSFPPLLVCRCVRLIVCC